MSKSKLSKRVRKGENSGKRRLAILVISLVLVGIVLGFVGYGLSYGAVVDFTFGGASDVRQSYQLIAISRLQPATIDIAHIFMRNTGSTGITLIVTMSAINAVISSGYYGPYGDTADIQVYLLPGTRYQLATFYLTLPKQVSTFTLRATVGRVMDFSSITSLATSALSPIQPTSPTTLVYTQVPANPISYKLAQQY
jgi:hypothetical protein